MNNVAILALSFCLLALCITALSLNISRLRLRYKVNFGDGGHKDLLAAVRAHGNAIEQATLFIPLSLIYVLLPGAQPSVVLVSSAVFLASRLLHAFAVLARSVLSRQIAHVFTVLAHVTLVVVVGTSAFAALSVSSAQ